MVAVAVPLIMVPAAAAVRVMGLLKMVATTSLMASQLQQTPVLEVEEDQVVIMGVNQQVAVVQAVQVSF